VAVRRPFGGGSPTRDLTHTMRACRMDRGQAAGRNRCRVSTDFGIVHAGGNFEVSDGRLVRRHLEGEDMISGSFRKFSEGSFERWIHIPGIHLQSTAAILLSAPVGLCFRCSGALEEITTKFIFVDQWTQQVQPQTTACWLM